MSDRTSLMTWIFLSPAAVRMTSNSDFSSSPGAGVAPARGRGGGRHGHRGRRGHAEALLEVLQQLAQLEDGQLGDAVEDLVLGQGACHCGVLLVSCLGRSMGVGTGRRLCGYSAAESRPASAAASAASSRLGCLGCRRFGGWRLGGGSAGRVGGSAVGGLGGRCLGVGFGAAPRGRLGRSGSPAASRACSIRAESP